MPSSAPVGMRHPPGSTTMASQEIPSPAVIAPAARVYRTAAYAHKGTATTAPGRAPYSETGSGLPASRCASIQSTRRASSSPACTTSGGSSEGLARRSAAVDRIKIEGSRAGVGGCLGRRGNPQVGAHVEGEVMVHDLPHERHTGGVGRIVRVISAEREIGDEIDRSLLECIAGIEDAAGLADVEQRLAHWRRRLRERRQLNDAAEAVW